MKSTVRAGVGGWLGVIFLLSPWIHGQTQPAPTAGTASSLLVEGDPLIRTWTVPIYPPELKAQNVTGEVTVHLVVDETGAVHDLQVVKSSDHRFDEAVVTALRAATIEPGVEQSRAVPMGVSLTWYFKLPYPPRTERLPSLHVLPKTPASPEFTPDPHYPDAYLDRQLTAEVLLELEIGTEGRVSGAKILGASHPGFVRPALDAVNQWKFRPAKQGDLPVKDKKRAPLSFVYDDSRATVKRTQLEANGFALQLPEGMTSAAVCEVLPTIISMVDPVFPIELAQSGEEGEAEVSCTVNIQGLPEDVLIRNASHPACGLAAAAALEACAFSPALLRGQAVPVKLVQKHRFVLAPDGSSNLEPDELRLLRLVRAGEPIPSAKGLDGKLRPLWRAVPVFPAALRIERPKGAAEIEFAVDQAGRARIPKIISATREEFGWAAATAVSQWVFDPPTRGGQPTDVRVRIPVQFSPP